MRTWEQAIELMTARVDDTSMSVKRGFPHYADTSTGVWTASPDGDWTGGFWGGMLWLTLRRTEDRRYSLLAEQVAESLRTRATSDTAFRGFLFYYGAALGAILVGNEVARDVAIAGALGLADLYDPIARAIPLGGSAEEAGDVGRTEANIDTVQAGALLIWAANQNGDRRLREIGVAHAHRHIELCVRDDGSVCQSATFDPNTGLLVRRYTHKGYTNESTWARAQAWAMLGYAMIGPSAPEVPELGEVAVRTADWWIDHVPAGRVSYWDFEAPAEPPPRLDTSASAIAAAALLKLSATAAHGADRVRYRSVAEATVQALIDSYVTPASADDQRPRGMLTHGCYNHRIGLATDHELIWGDYFLYESLHVLSGCCSPTQA